MKKLCPRIRSFELITLDESSNTVLGDLADLISGRHFESLEDTHLTRGEDCRVARCLRTMVHVKEFSVQQDYVGDMTSLALESHF